jgi:hypothetical protein
MIFRNMLSSILKKDKVYFSDISLMVSADEGSIYLFVKTIRIFVKIFDECHHCNAEHPYKVLMEMLEESIDKQQVRNPLQIVGLTASMGVGTTG